MKTKHKWIVTWANGKKSELKKVGHYWRVVTAHGSNIGWQNFTRAKWAILGSGGTLKKVAV